MTATGDLYGLPLSTSGSAATAYNKGVSALLRVQEGGLLGISESIAHDPTFALGHAGLALLGHEYGAAVDVPARLAAARLHARRASERERSHVHAVVSHVAGDSRPLVAHLAEYPRDALLLSVAVPTIAFAGVTSVPEESWEIVERARAGLRQRLVVHRAARLHPAGAVRAGTSRCGSPARRWTRSRRPATRCTPARTSTTRPATMSPAATGSTGGSSGPGRTADNLAHYSWHAALHELSMGDLVGGPVPLHGRPRPAGGRRMSRAGRLVLAAVAVGDHAGRI